jgi:hypothetical protein
MKVTLVIQEGPQKSEIVLQDMGKSQNFYYVGIGDWKNKDMDQVIAKVGINKKFVVGDQK